MQKTLRAAGVLALALSAALAAAVSLKTYTGSGALIISIPLASINKMTFDDYWMYIDTGSTHEVVQKPVAGGAGDVKAVFAADAGIQRARALGSGFGKPIVANRNSTVALSISLLSAGFVKLTVYTSKGAQVRAIVCARLEAGTHVLGWDGADASGKPAAPGVYHIVGTIDRSPVAYPPIVKP
jgi:hypothetical protein